MTGTGSNGARVETALLGLLALVWGLDAAWAWRWTTDDAFISFRYADNLVNGLGLVFNEGQRVEGYTNLLWTLWVAAGLGLGAEAETWANVWGIAFYLGSILLLLLNHGLMQREGEGQGWFVPLAALGAAAHRDWSIFATSGLETSAFTFLLLACFLIVTRRPSAPRPLVAAGGLAALAALTRPDGLLPAGVLGLVLLWTGRPWWRSALAYGGAFAALWLPATAWRVSYYGQFFPNTYYAKSAYLTWYDQGWHYAGLYFQAYWPLLLGPPLVAAAWWLGRGGRSGQPGCEGSTFHRQSIAALAVAAAYTLYVVRLGGDFMFARLLIPVTPFYLLLVELGLMRVLRGRTASALVATALLLAAMTWTPRPVSGSKWSRGVADERMYYSAERVAALDHSAEVLGRYFEGLPVRVAFYGDEARIVYKARFPVAIESHAGLTEPEVARQELTERGRVGHEKHASAEYLIERRKAHFAFSKEPVTLIRLGDYIPEVAVAFDRDVSGLALHWDPEMMRGLRRRGAEVPDFVAALDRYIARLDATPAGDVARTYERLRHFYFAHVDDPRRERAFLDRLGGR